MARKGIRDRGPGMRGRPRPHSSTSWFFSCVFSTSHGAGTVPAVGLSQVALKIEVSVTQVSIRHRGPRPSGVYQCGEKEKKSWVHGGGGGGSWEPWGWGPPPSGSLL